MTYWQVIGLVLILRPDTSLETALRVTTDIDIYKQQQQPNDTYIIFLIIFQFNWTRYFNKLTEGLSNPVTDSEEIFVGAPKYLEELVQILKNNTRG